MRFYLDKRSVGRDGRCALRLRMSKDGETAMPLTGIRIRPEDWKDNRCTDARLNVRLRDILDNAEDFVLKLKMDGTWDGMSAQELADAILRKCLSADPKPKKGETFSERLLEYRGRQTKRNTRNLYDWTHKTLTEFDPSFTERPIKKMDYDYIVRFDKWCRDSGKKVNSISILMRNIRAVLNEAEKDGISVSYPFKRFHIKNEETRKRSLTDDELRLFMTCKVNNGQERYRDYFLLMLYLIGINMTDLFQARPEDLKNGRLNYTRDKTGKLYSVKVEPEAMEIIKKYRGKEYLLEALDGHVDFLSWSSQLNKRLKAIGQVVGRYNRKIKESPFKDISTYWARHTWATLAYRLGVSVDTIAQALGHSDRSHSVTMIYIKPDQSRVDEANRKVIDYVSGAL